MGDSVEFDFGKAISAFGVADKASLLSALTELFQDNVFTTGEDFINTVEAEYNIDLEEQGIYDTMLGLYTLLKKKKNKRATEAGSDDGSSDDEEEGGQGGQGGSEGIGRDDSDSDSDMVDVEDCSEDGVDKTIVRALPYTKAGKVRKAFPKSSASRVASNLACILRALVHPARPLSL